MPACSSRRAPIRNVCASAGVPLAGVEQIRSSPERMKRPSRMFTEARLRDDRFAGFFEAHEERALSPLARRLGKGPRQ